MHRLANRTLVTRFLRKTCASMKMSTSASSPKHLSPRHLTSIKTLENAFRRIAEVNTCTPAHLETMAQLRVENAIAGYLLPSFAERLLSYPDTFVRDPSSSSSSSSSSSRLILTFASTLVTPEDRTAAASRVTEDLARRGVITGWRNELYPVVTSFHQAPLFLLERAAAPYFGIKAYGVHVNGYVEVEEQGTREKSTRQLLWVAKRSAVKPTWPGMLDHLVAGGQPHGLSCFENVLKEAEEEASVPAELALHAVAAGAVSYASLQPEGVKRDVLFVYDLKLPREFVPRPLDGEVESFRLEGMDKVADIVLADSSTYKPNCNLVVLDFMLRHGYLTPEHPGYLELLTALRTGDCT